MNNLKTIKKSPTIVIISHNIEIAKDADQIIVIEDGQIIADHRNQIDFP
jgi:ABC-type bacteriocin/lantibiotic exporter with double-glycine peptidase domain